MRRTVFLLTLIALPLAADEIAFECRPLTVKLEWPRTIAAEGPEEQIELKLLEPRNALTVDSMGGPKQDGLKISCTYQLDDADPPARYGGAGAVKKCPPATASASWPPSLGNYEMTKAPASTLTFWALENPPSRIIAVPSDSKPDICRYRDYREGGVAQYAVTMPPGYSCRRLRNGALACKK